MESPTIGPKTLVYENPHQQVYHVKADFNGFSKEYFVNEFGKRTGVVVAKGRNILLVRQYRLLVNRMTAEIPGGKIDEGETAETATIRECFEETGVRCNRLRPLIDYHPGLDTYHNPTHLFYCQDFEETASVENFSRPGETTGYLWMPLDKCLDMVFSGQIMDSFSIIGLLAYYYRLTWELNCPNIASNES